CDAEGRVFEDSPSWRALTGQSEEALRSLGWVGAVHPDERAAAEAAWRATVARKAPFDAEWRIVDASGEIRHMRVRALPLVNDDDTVRGWVGVGEDITDRKRAELEAERANERAREDRKSTRLNSSHVKISYAVFCLKKKKRKNNALIDDSYRSKLHVRS